MFGLFKRRPKPANTDSKPPLVEAAHSNLTEQIQLNRLLLGASASGNAKRVGEYLRMGADSKWRNTESMFTFDPYLDASALPLAAQSGSVETVQTLLNYSTNPNLPGKGGRTALMFAAEGGHKIIVRLLLKAKADPKLLDQDGNTAFLYAIRRGDAPLAGELGRGVSSVGSLVRALQWSVESGSVECVQLAVSLGAPLNEPGEDGLLALERIRDLYGSGKLTKVQAAGLASLLVTNGADMAKVGPNSATS